LFVFPLLMLYAATMDVLTMRIANLLSIGLVVAFVVVAPIAGMPGTQMLMHLGIGVAALVVCMVLFQLRFVGGGDAKLLAAASLWVGYEQFAPFIIWVTVFGGLLAVLMLAYRNMPATALPLPDWALRLHVSGTGIPYGVAITGGALMVYPATGIPQLLGS
jgi:prepilin peptidase CpaA